jgi:hypothetical protein
MKLQSVRVIQLDKVAYSRYLTLQIHWIMGYNPPVNHEVDAGPARFFIVDLTAIALHARRMITTAATEARTT